MSIREYAALSMFPQRLAGWVSGSLGVLGLLLVGLGVYGVTAFSVARRTREIGIRVALGAGRRDVLRMVFGQGLRLAGLGVAIGLVLAAAAAQLLASLLYGVSPLDPLTFGAVAAAILGVSALATWLPARRATAVDPLSALRQE
jgi:ABC-type antimicrobial peptide transport system permease subunit